MTYLLDAQLLLWSMYEPERLGHGANILLIDGSHKSIFSTTSIREVAIKYAKFPRLTLLILTNSDKRSYGLDTKTDAHR